MSLATPALPTSPLAEQAMERARPQLQKEFKALGFTWGSELFLRIFKDTQELEVWVRKGPTFALYKTYAICTYGGMGLGPKTQQGDGRAPEGFYTITPRQLNPYSQYHLAFNLGYPNAYDQAQGYTGSALMVHGKCVSIGCYAMTDPVIEDLYTLAHAAFSNGHKAFAVHIFPFRLNARNLAAEKDNPWFGFWTNLQEGYQLFEQKKRPPLVRHRGKRYTFAEN